MFLNIKILFSSIISNRASADILYVYMCAETFWKHFIT